MTKRHALALALTLAGLILAISPAGAEVASQATSIRRTFYPFHIDANHTDAILSADQDGSGSIADFKDGGVSEYTFDQTSATFVNQLNLSGALNIDGAVDLDGAITGAANLEHLYLPTYATASFTYTAAAGGTVNLFALGAGETWLIEDIRVEVTSNFNATGDDATLTIGDGGDADGFCVLADAELQAADTEGTGWEAGWQCQVAATRGVYIDGTGGFIYDDASAETIDAFIDEASGETLAAGAATVHLWYTRIQ